MEEKLQKDGFLLFKNILDPTDGYRCFNNNKINYTRIINFIENKMISKLNKIMNWQSDYVKFRVSDNNNSADASAFHKDVIPQTMQKCESYTFLSYLDKTIMEIIPESHNNLNYDYDNLFNLYNKKIRIEINPGDLLLFNSTLLHRGIFTQQLASRKLIQVFEIFPNKKKLNELKDSYIHVPAKETYSGIMQSLAKFELSAYIMNLIGFFNAASGYGIMNKDNLPNNALFLSSEGLRGRLQVIPNTWQDINKYIIKHETVNLPSELYDEFNTVCYRNKFAFCFVVLFIIIILIIYTLNYLYKKRNKLF